MSAIIKAARRKTGVLDEPAVSLAGWKFAAPRPVIVSERRSRESNDLYRRSRLIPPPPSLFIPCHPSPSQFGVGLRGFRPQSSPIGVDFSDLPSNWRRVQLSLCVPQCPLCGKRFWGFLARS